jgi:hypothetical protein
MNTNKVNIHTITVASSTGGKTVLIQNLILDVYRDCFSRIFIFSPSVHTDPTFVEVKKYIRKEMKVDDKKEDIYFEHYNPEELQQVIDTQTKVITYMKNSKLKKLHSILVVVDDHADNLNLVRHSHLLHGLATRGRHQAISFILSTQKYRSLANIIRLNASSLYIFKLKNQTELDAFIEESSALVDKKTLLEMYKLAVKEPYSFLYININSKDINQMFYIRFEQVMKVE